MPASLRSDFIHIPGTLIHIAVEHARLEAASQRALAAQACSFQSLRSILRRGLDRQLSPSPEQERSSPQHRNLRGSRYYVSPSKLVQ